MQTLQDHICQRFSDLLQSCEVLANQLVIEIKCKDLREVCQALRDESDFQFETLIDICGVDYLDYGVTQWQTDQATTEGFSRGLDSQEQQRVIPWDKPRFAVVYHLLSLTHNHRIRIRTFAQDDLLRIDSVIDIWASADWYEREAFDLYGIIFEGHPDLRRILTDYGFIGHPFRKDFPLSGNVEVRYDADIGRVIYEPVTIEPRTLVPKVIRADSRYEKPEVKPSG